jgi:hypothetical protein
MCLISGDSTRSSVQRHPRSYPHAPVDEPQFAGPRANLGSHARSLCASFEYEIDIHRHYWSQVCCVTNVYILHCNALQPSMAADDLRSQQQQQHHHSEDLAASGASTSISLLPIIAIPPATRTNPCTASQPAKKSRSRPTSFTTLPVHSVLWHPNASPRLLRKRPRGRQLPTGGGGTLPRDIHSHERMLADGP